jgi:H+/Cl- antiporter ClcA
MDGFQHALNVIVNFFQEGFAHVNAMLGLLIALYSAYRMSAWKDLWKLALGAVVIHIIAMILVPMIDHDAPFRLPQLLDVEFWKFALALFLGYIVAIAAFFFVKANVLKGGSHH